MIAYKVYTREISQTFHATRRLAARSRARVLGDGGLHLPRGRCRRGSRGCKASVQRYTYTGTVVAGDSRLVRPVAHTAGARASRPGARIRARRRAARRAARAGHGARTTRALREELQAAARAAGLLTPTVAREYGGLGLDVRAQSAVLEEAGYSLLGPPALNCAAPDEGNMHLLDAVGSDEQKERCLRPLAAGALRSAFAMSEPPPGAGSDPVGAAHRGPSACRAAGASTAASASSPGREGAAFAICMARTDDRARRRSRRIDVHRGRRRTPGMRVERRIDTLDSSFAGGHAELVFDDCRVTDDAVLGEVGLGFRLAQARLAPARLTHCMRWLGLARRSLDVALDYAAERELFGARLDEQGIAQALIADCVIDLDASRGADPPLRGGARRRRARAARVGRREGVRRRGRRPRGRPGDAAVRRRSACPTSCRSRASPPSSARSAIYDGPSETHRMAIAQRAARRRAAARARPRHRRHRRRGGRACAARRCVVRLPRRAALDAAGLGRGPLDASSRSARATRT